MKHSGVKQLCTNMPGLSGYLCVRSILRDFVINFWSMVKGSFFFPGLQCFLFSFGDIVMPVPAVT